MLRPAVPVSTRTTTRRLHPGPVDRALKRAPIGNPAPEAPLSIDLSFRDLFESSAGLVVVLRPDLTIAAVTDAYLRVSMTSREQILGRSIFDVFPDNPEDPGASGVSNLRASFERVRTALATDRMAVGRHDIRRPAEQGGGFEERYWSLVNTPVLDAGGQLAWVRHQVEDVTEVERLKQVEADQQRDAAGLRSRAAEVEAEVLQRAGELQKSNQQLEHANAELRQSEKFLDSLLENIPAVVFVKDATHLRFVRFNRAGEVLHGANDFLVKPLDTEEVVLRVRNLLETRRLHQALKVRNVDLAAEVTARTSDLRESESQWTAVTQSLGRLEPLATPEATAEAISEALSTLPDLALVAVIAFGATGAAIPLARRSTSDTRSWLVRRLSDDASTGIRNRVALGSWLGTQDGLGDTGARRRWLDPHITGIALVPLRTSAGAVGALVAGTLAPDGISRLSRRIPALEAFAAMASALLAPGIVARQRDDGLRREIEAIIGGVDFHPVFQPIVDLGSGTVAGYEALTRFADGMRPDRRFTAAEAVGLGLELENACLSAAVKAAGQNLDRACWLSLNVSPTLVLEHDRLARVLQSSRVPIVLEITEHAPIEDYTSFRSAMAALGPGVRCAIDDAGAGFSSFRHIIELRPDFVKLDIGMVRSIEQDPAREALVAGMAYFANKTGCELIAEGIETVAERDLLHLLSVGLGQGFLLGRPEPLSATVQARGAKRAPASAGPVADPVAVPLPLGRPGISPLTV